MKVRIRLEVRKSSTPGIKSSSESLNTFRNLIAAENEAEISAYRFLENGAYYNLPPQNTPGDYAALVHENFNSAINVAHFRSIFDREYFELQNSKTTEPTGFTPGEQDPEQRPQQFGRYLEKGFSTQCILYVLKFVEVSQWCNAVDFLGKGGR
ncbi:hypothetical protein HAX54_044138 [Datura stramonium]|uniref:Uncharacterized protein n=1 Tax=Datura stramonium TaxID=4076 RepID=A0ABS8W6Q7_DATST|nr:hypothetical protein [Datura stramonium]